MARQFNLTTQTQECMKETYLKELMTRINWRRRYAKNFPTIATSKLKPKIKDHFKLPSISDPSFQVANDNKSYESSHQNAQSPQDRSKTNVVETTSAMVAQMRPVSPKTQSLLYHGTSKQEEGRYHYMKARNNLKPEEKYLFPLATSWDYGWHLAGNSNNINCPLHRRCRIVTDTFFRKNGIPPEPNLKDMAL
ncbi:protein SPMIP1 [Mixophyes fleayi]|uniref:protein SPMIP1 n=1 Tax=Mixophyes fleayi TaxID=3061075 RepID=UPI003F4D9611